VFSASETVLAFRPRADSNLEHRIIKMARKPGTRVEFVLFDVFHEDGSQRLNRKRIC
jgi:RNase P/RNase MRP subunit p30